MNERFTNRFRVAGCSHQLIIKVLERRSLEWPRRVIDGGESKAVAQARIQAPSSGEEVFEGLHIWGRDGLASQNRERACGTTPARPEPPSHVRHLVSLPLN